MEDDSFPDEQKLRLKEALANAGVEHTIETYDGARHGWVPSDATKHDALASERHFQSLIALFDSTLETTR